MRSQRIVVAVGLLSGCALDYSLEGDETNRGGDNEDTRPLDGSDEGGQPGSGETAGVTGRICSPAGDSYVVGATASIHYDTDGDGVGDGLVEDVTDGDGWFLLEGVPLGQHTIQIEKGSFSTQIPVVLDTPGELVQLAEEECLDPGSVRIAVVTGQYDHIEHIIEDLGLEYDTYSGTSGQYMTLLRDPARLAEYDIIFFNCGMSDSWTAEYGTIGTNIREYVQAGGSIYTSDWAFQIFEAAFSNAVDFYGNDSVATDVEVGMPGTITAQVLDANFQAILGGTTARLSYDLDSWAVPVSASGSNADVLLQGTVQTFDWWTWSSDTVRDAPLAVRVSSNGGIALYTSFHNENQITTDMQHMLEEIILSL